MRRTVLLTIATLAAIGSAHAAKDVPFPRFNSQNYCEVTVVRSEGGYSMDDCKSDERASEFDAKMQWGDLSMDARANCHFIATQSGQSYFILSACLSHFDPRYQQGWGQPPRDRTSEIARSFRR